MRSVRVTVVAALAFGLSALPGQAQSLRSEIETVVHDYLADHPEDVQRIVKDYLVQHPEVLRESFSALIKRREPTAVAPASTNANLVGTIKDNAAQLFTSARQVTLGNPSGDVTMVEFFDYNCGFCKRALADTMALLKDDPKLRIVLKEFPILGPGSVEAAKVAVAVRMQDSGGQKYLAFHQKLLGARGPANKETALAAAKEAGLDMALIERDLASDEIGQTLAENDKLAHALGIGGTPGYIIGEAVIPGAVGVAALQAKVDAARTHKVN